MVITANIAYFKGEFVASLSDGKRIERYDWREMARALHELGVGDTAIEYQWHTGQRMITAGQQVALRAEIRRLSHMSANHTVRNHRVAAA